MELFEKKWRSTHIHVVEYDFVKIFSVVVILIVIIIALVEQ
jgi:hypothetical protein